MSSVHWLLDTVLDLYGWVLILSIIMSWLLAFNIINSYQPFVRSLMSFLYAATEPVLRPIRRFVPVVGGFDLSVLVLYLFIQFLRRLLFEVFYA